MIAASPGGFFGGFLLEKFEINVLDTVLIVW